MSEYHFSKCANHASHRDRGQNDGIRRLLEDNISAGAKIFPIICVIIAFVPGLAVAGSLDISFDTDGILLHHNAAGGNSSDDGRGILVLPNGHILIVGASWEGSAEDLSVWHLTPEGLLDPSFGGGDGIFTHHNAAGGVDPVGSDRGYAVAIQSDSKIVVAGYSYNAALDVDMVVWRLNADGTLDTTFDTDGWLIRSLGVGNDASAGDVAIQSDGKIIVVGSINYGVTSDMIVWRFTSTGSTDTSFDTDGYALFHDASGDGTFDGASGVAIQSDSRVVVVGTSGNDAVVWRLLTDGSLDASFDTNGILLIYQFDGLSENSASDVLIQDDGMLVISGSGEHIGWADVYVWRLANDGQYDATFGGGNGWFTCDVALGGNSNEHGRALKRSPGGKIIVAGDVSGTGGQDLAVWCLNSDGTLDNQFDTDGLFFHNNAGGGNGSDAGFGMDVQSDSRIVITGYTATAADGDMVVWRLLETVSDSVPDITYPIGTVFVRLGDTIPLSATALDNDSIEGLIWTVSDTNIISATIEESSDRIVIHAVSGAVGDSDIISVSVHDSIGFSDTETVTIKITYYTDGDLDGKVGFEDVAAMGNRFGISGEGTIRDPYDANDDWIVNAADLDKLNQEYGQRLE